MSLSLFSWVQVVEMCLQQELYDGLIHVHNRGLHDYGTPLLELLLQLRATLKKAGKNLPSELEGQRGGRRGGEERGGFMSNLLHLHVHEY